MKKEKNNSLNLTSKDVKVIAETLGGQTIPPNERLVEAGARYLKELKD